MGTITRQIKFRRGTAAEWQFVNPVLAVGEPGFATDTLIMKVGDGATAWNDLVSTLPDLSNYATLADAQTLTNKTMSGADNTFTNIPLSSIPDLPGTYATLSEAQTLTNKTISGSSNTLTNISQSSVSNLTNDLAAKAALAGATFTGFVGYGKTPVLALDFETTLSITTARFKGGGSGAPVMIIDDVSNNGGVSIRTANTERGRIYSITDLFLQAISRILYLAAATEIIFRAGGIGNTVGAFTSTGFGSGTITPRRKGDFLDAANPQIRWTHTDNSKYGEAQVDTNGNTAFTTTGDLFSFNKRFRNANLTTYADNAAALAGGLIAGDFYKKADGTVMVTV